MTNIKRFSALALCAALLLTCAACTPDDEPGTVVVAESPLPPSEPPPPPPPPVSLMVGDVPVSLDEFRYVFYSKVKDFKELYGDVGDYGFDPNIPLSRQMFDDDNTWFDMFADDAKETIRNAVIYAREATRNGVSLTADERRRVSDNIELMILNAKKEGRELDELLSKECGGTVDTETARSVLAREALAEKYRSVLYASSDATDDEIAEFYELNPAAFDEISYREYVFTDDYDGAAEFLSAIDGEQSFTGYLKNALGVTDDSSTLRSGIVGNESEDIAVWLFAPERVMGDTTLIDTGDGRYHVLYYIMRSRPEEECVEARHILITAGGDADKAREQAENILTAWEAAGADENAFADLAETYSEDFGSRLNGGLYEDITRGRMEEPFEDWCFDKERKYGDTTLADASYGTHAIFFIRRRELWESRVKLVIRQQRFEEITAALEAAYPTETLTTDIGE